MERKAMKGLTNAYWRGNLKMNFEQLARGGNLLYFHDDFIIMEGTSVPQSLASCGRETERCSTNPGLGCANCTKFTLKGVAWPQCCAWRGISPWVVLHVGGEHICKEGSSTQPWCSGPTLQAVMRKCHASDLLCLKAVYWDLTLQVLGAFIS